MYKTYKSGGSRLVVLDRLNFRILDVHVDEFEAFDRDLQQCELLGALIVNREFGKGASQYKYNLNVGWQGDGAVYIGYHHNSENPKLKKERFDVKIEFNPNKHDFDKNKMLWICLNRFKDFRKGIKAIDLAFDFPYGIDEVVPVSLTGKTLNKFQTTYYYGQRGKHGFLKVYDKAAEEGIEGKKTRVEYTVKFADPITLQIFQSIDSFSINEQYAVTFCNLDKFDDEIQCYLYCIKSGFKGLTDFKSRRKREKIKKALQEVEHVDFDSLYQESKEEIVNQIKKCLNFQWYDKDKAISSISEAIPF